MKLVSNDAKRHGVAGFEFLEGIPGSIGGALRMNAGAMNSATFDVVETVRLMDFTGQIHERTRRELEVAYRSCPTLRTHIALGAVLQGHSELREVIEQRMLEFSKRRWKSQPATTSPSRVASGSFRRRVATASTAWQLWAWPWHGSWR